MSLIEKNKVKKKGIGSIRIRGVTYSNKVMVRKSYCAWATVSRTDMVTVLMQES